jgi:hypothetical protein
MGSTKDFKRVKIPFDKRTPISKTSKEILLDSFGHIRAVIDGGFITIQMKKLSGNQKEFIRIDTNVSPPTIELLLEKSQS